MIVNGKFVKKKKKKRGNKQPLQSIRLRYVAMVLV